ncbi:MAG: hypothetical protein IPM24_06655 [Bryobacterales bacterium]|nr:hypothetical protein [Bryobacterales bacterium]
MTSPTQIRSLQAQLDELYARRAVIDRVLEALLEYRDSQPRQRVPKRRQAA